MSSLPARQMASDRWPPGSWSAMATASFCMATKMGGPGAPDDLDAGPKTQVWLATSDDPEAIVPGQYFYHQK